MKKISLVVMILVIFACQKDDEILDQKVENSNAELQINNNAVCLTKVVGVDGDIRGVQEDSSLLWDDGQTISVSFLHIPSVGLRENVESFAQIWENHANIDFVFLPDGFRNAAITIGIEPGAGGHVKALGSKIVKAKDKDFINMFLGEEAGRGTILHEFGHALGLSHEQLSPEEDLCFDTEALYALYAQSGWDSATVDSQILNVISYDQLTNSSDYDEDSVMHYFFPAAVLCNSFVSVGGNDFLSMGDTEFIEYLYPFSWTFDAPVIASATFGISDNWGDNTLKTIADINGDGQGDVIAFGFNDTFVALGNSNGTFGNAILASTTFANNDGWGNQTRRVGDVNGDGRADIIGFGLNDTFVALGNTNGTFGNAILASTTFASNDGWGSYPRKIADVNGDGRGDIVGFGANDTYVALGNSNGTFGAPFIASSTFANSDGWTDRVREVKDVNNDGRADIIGFGIDDVIVSLANANGTFGTPFISLREYFTDWNNVTNLIRIADINGDNLNDIVGFGEKFIWVSYGEGDGNFTQAHKKSFNKFTTDTGWNYSHKRQVFDIDGDGNADIIGFGQDDTYVSLSND